MWIICCEALQVLSCTPFRDEEENLYLVGPAPVIYVGEVQLVYTEI